MLAHCNVGTLLPHTRGHVFMYWRPVLFQPDLGLNNDVFIYCYNTHIVGINIFIWIWTHIVETRFQSEERRLH